MGKEDKIIYAFETEKVFPNGTFQGFRPGHEFNYEEGLLPHLQQMRRGDAEISSTHKHPIPYVLVVNPNEKTVFAYQRASNKSHAHEERLHGRWSLGVGGHVEPEDTQEGQDPIYSTMIRELEEEIQTERELGKHQVLGYVNDERDEVGKVHLGILYVIETKGDVTPRGKEMAQGRLMKLSEIEQLCSQEGVEMEGWSEIALKPLQHYFNSLDR